ncbi:MAG: type II toxin-antitoxin system HipA family toxin YjjJ [Polyangiaceae bacterium]|nr:type II toxin-antitoxin system HipA family toxin YjjJ [Polyangiaceae bacterium]
MAAPQDFETLWRKATRLLLRQPSSSAAELEKQLGVSHATWSRLVARHSQDLLVVGRARATRYSHRRVLGEVAASVPMYEIDALGRARLAARLHGVAGDAFYVEGLVAEVESGFFTDLPYFLNDMRPAGFLGRLVPQQHPDLLLPADVRLWSADQCLRYMLRFGSDLVGNWIVGDGAFQHYLQTQGMAPTPIDAHTRGASYDKLADDVLGGTAPGSSAGGEQPKFLARLAPHVKSVLVKFSPPRDSALGRRRADLLVCEHLAHATLNQFGQEACRSEVVESASRLYLEVERFDRTPQAGRVGTLSLLALDAEFVGQLETWSRSAAALAALGRIPLELVERIIWLEWFGHLIGNTDMHAANLSFVTEGTRVRKLAPVYDMTPALYVPLQEQLVVRELRLPPPHPAIAGMWRSIVEAAETFWREVERHPCISKPFKRIAKDNTKVVQKFAELAGKLP